MKIRTISIVIPVFNEVDYITKTIDAVSSVKIPFRKEIIVVDDGSTDGTSNKLKKYKLPKNQKDSLIILKNKKNQGKGTSVKVGFLKSKGDVVIIQDADLEYNPKDYPLLIDPFLENNADVVYGSRFVTTKPRRVLYFWHYVINIGLTFFSNMLTNLNLTDMETGYKAFKGDVIRGLAKELKSSRFGFEPEITAKISKKNLKIYEVGISYTGRSYEQGKKIGWKDGFEAIYQIIKSNVFR